MNNFLESITYFIKVVFFRLIEETYRAYTKIIYHIIFGNQKITFDMKRIRQNVKKYGHIVCRVGRRLVEVPIENEFGKNYPVYATDIVHELFNIKENELVVDVGGGIDR